MCKGLQKDRRVFRIGDVYWMKFSGTGSEQRGWRPGIVFQNNVGNAFSPNVIAIPLTTAKRNINQPTHVVLPAKETGIGRDSIALCENPERMSKDNIGSFISTIPEAFMAKIASANLIATSAIAFITQVELLAAWKAAKELNLTVIA